MPEVVDILDDDENDDDENDQGGEQRSARLSFVTINLMDDDSENDEVQIVEKPAPNRNRNPTRPGESDDDIEIVEGPPLSSTNGSDQRRGKGGNNKKRKGSGIIHLGGDDEIEILESVPSETRRKYASQKAPMCPSPVASNRSSFQQRNRILESLPTEPVRKNASPTIETQTPTAPMHPSPVASNRASFQHNQKNSAAETSKATAAVPPRPRSSPTQMHQQQVANNCSGNQQISDKAKTKEKHSNHQPSPTSTKPSMNNPKIVSNLNHHGSPNKTNHTATIASKSPPTIPNDSNQIFQYSNRIRLVSSRLFSNHHVTGKRPCLVIPARVFDQLFRSDSNDAAQSNTDTPSGACHEAQTLGNESVGNSNKSQNDALRETPSTTQAINQSSNDRDIVTVRVKKTVKHGNKENHQNSSALRSIPNQAKSGVGKSTSSSGIVATKPKINTIHPIHRVETNSHRANLIQKNPNPTAPTKYPGQHISKSDSISLRFLQGSYSENHKHSRSDAETTNTENAKRRKVDLPAGMRQHPSSHPPTTRTPPINTTTSSVNNPASTVATPSSRLSISSKPTSSATLTTSRVSKVLSKPGDNSKSHPSHPFQPSQSSQKSNLEPELKQSGNCPPVGPANKTTATNGPKNSTKQGETEKLRKIIPSSNDEEKEKLRNINAESKSLETKTAMEQAGESAATIRSSSSAPVSPSKKTAGTRPSSQTMQRSSSSIEHRFRLIVKKRGRLSITLDSTGKHMVQNHRNWIGEYNHAIDMLYPLPYPPPGFTSKSHVDWIRIYNRALQNKEKLPPPLFDPNAPLEGGKKSRHPSSNTLEKGESRDSRVDKTPLNHSDDNGLVAMSRKANQQTNTAQPKDSQSQSHPAAPAIATTATTKNNINSCTERIGQVTSATHSNRPVGISKQIVSNDDSGHVDAATTNLHAPLNDGANKGDQDNNDAARRNFPNKSSIDSSTVNDKMVIEIPDDDDSDDDTDDKRSKASDLKLLRMSRDHQFAVHLHQQMNPGSPITHLHSEFNGRASSRIDSNLPSPVASKSLTGKVIELLDDDDDVAQEMEGKDNEKRRNEKDPSASANPSCEDTGIDDRGAMFQKDSISMKKIPNEETKDVKKKKKSRFTLSAHSSDGENLPNEDTKNAEKKKKKKRSRFTLSTQSSDEENSVSSAWTDPSHDPSETRDRESTMTLRRTKNPIVSASEIESQCTSATTIEKHRCDFTGKEILTGRTNRKPHVQHGTIIGSDERETVNSSIRQSREISSFKPMDTRVPFSEPTQMQRQKPPPPLPHAEAVKMKKNVLKLSERLHLEEKKAQKRIFERALLQQKACNQQTASAQTFSPRIAATSTRLNYLKKNESQSKGNDGHTAIVNSSLTVLQTVDHHKVEEETKRKDLHHKACKLSLMPYDFKILQTLFANILNKLPSELRYHPEVHDHVSKLLYTPPPQNKDACTHAGTKPKLEVPCHYREAPRGEKVPPEVTSKIKVADENNGDYLSVMKSFRDFCVQCKTFDCQFHITSYPDAATQACVATLYDKRALQRQSRTVLDPDDPFSYLLPTIENKMVLIPGGNSNPSNNVTSVEVIESPVKAENATIHSDKKGKMGMVCPFCKFHCEDQEKLSKHVGRYHQDTFFCREIGSKITATVRTQEKETMKPDREYFHSRSLIPIQSGHFDRDSDDESDYGWYDDYRRDLMKDLVDVSENEKRIHGMWNRFLGYSPVVIADKDIPKRCFYFIQKHIKDLDDLEWELYQLLITFWERHLLSVIHVEKLMHLFHETRKTEGLQQNDGAAAPLTPRKIVLISRLHLIFESLGANAESKLRSALNRDDVKITDLVKTPMLAKHLWPKKPKRTRFLTVAMRMRAEDISRPFFFPCSHSGKCTEENGCTCVENDYLCTKHCVWGDYGDNFFPGCTCTGDCSASKQCPCRDANRECDPDICGCAGLKDSTEGCRKTCKCSNMDVSLAKRAALFIGQSQVQGAGLGLFTKNALKKGDYVDEYIGEFIKGEFQLGRSEEYYFDHSDDYIIDATHQGNKTRYLNHSLTPNIEANHRFVNGEKRIAFYAKHDIPAQTELFYSYGKSYNNIWRSKGLPQLCVDSDDDGYKNEDDDD